MNNTVTLSEKPPKLKDLGRLIVQKLKKRSSYGVPAQNHPARKSRDHFSCATMGTDFENRTGGFGKGKSHHYRLKMNIKALQPEERAYLLGLYFADGYLNPRYKSTQILNICFQGNERDLAKKTVEMFARSGLSPILTAPKRLDEIVVSVSATNLLSFFPNKNRLVSLGIDPLKSWISDNQLNTELGVPFIAGLLDGDGFCRPLHQRSGVFGSIQEKWEFSQKKFPFLIDFLVQYISKMTSNGASINHGRNGQRVVRVLASGREALFKVGISRWSFKVNRCRQEAEEMKRQILEVKSKFQTVSQAARVLHLPCNTLWKWCMHGQVKHMRIRGALSRSVSGRVRHCCYIPFHEVQRLQIKLRDNARRQREILSGTRYLTVKEASRFLGLSTTTVRDYCRRNNLKAKVISISALGGAKKMYFIPAEELKCLVIYLQSQGH